MQEAFKIKNSAETQYLQDAFEKFNQASLKLEAKYQELLLETESLRNRLKEKEAEVKRAEKLSLLGETAAALAHEVRNPLGAMKLFISMLREDISDRPDSLKLIDQIDRSVNSLDNIVCNILQFSKRENIKFSPLNLHSLIQEQVSSFKIAQASKADFRLKLEGNPYICGSEHGLRQVFHNLILNALQATRFGGEIEITVCCDLQETRVTVKDNGAGIPESVIETIFDPFVTTKNEGTGLGLAVVAQIINQHGGTIRAVNQNGAQFIISLPQQSSK